MCFAFSRSWQKGLEGFLVSVVDSVHDLLFKFVNLGTAAVIYEVTAPLSAGR